MSGSPIITTVSTSRNKDDDTLTGVSSPNRIVYERNPKLYTVLVIVRTCLPGTKQHYIFVGLAELLYYRAMSECSSNCLTYVFCRIPAQGLWHRICAARLYNTRRSTLHPLRASQSIRPGKVRRHYILGFCLYKLLINNTSYKYHKSPVGLAPSSSLSPLYLSCFSLSIFSSSVLSLSPSTSLP